MVRVFSIKSNHVTVIPIVESHTAKENEELFQQTIEKLKEGKTVTPSRKKDTQFTSKFIL
jgi:hypothetical protein